MQGVFIKKLKIFYFLRVNRYDAIISAIATTTNAGAHILIGIVPNGSVVNLNSTNNPRPYALARNNDSLFARDLLLK